MMAPHAMKKGNDGLVGTTTTARTIQSLLDLPRCHQIGDAGLAAEPGCWMHRHHNSQPRWQLRDHERRADDRVLLWNVQIFGYVHTIDCLLNYACRAILYTFVMPELVPVPMNYHLKHLIAKVPINPECVWLPI